MTTLQEIQAAAMKLHLRVIALGEQQTQINQALTEVAAGVADIYNDLDELAKQATAAADPEPAADPAAADPAPAADPAEEGENVQGPVHGAPSGGQ